MFNDFIDWYISIINKKFSEIYVDRREIEKYLEKEFEEKIQKISKVYWNKLIADIIKNYNEKLKKFNKELDKNNTVIKIDN